MRRGQTGAVYGVANVWGDTHARSGRWDPTGPARSITPSHPSGPKNLNPSKGDWPDGPDDWVAMEVYVYGADSVIHVVNGMRVFKMTDLRHNRLMLPCGGGGGAWGTGPELPLTNGKICVQIESANITYRNWEIRPLEKDGGPTALGHPAGGTRGLRKGLAARMMPGEAGVMFSLGAGTDRQGPATLEVRTPQGILVRSLRAGSGAEIVAWNLEDESGRRVGRGLYLARLVSDRPMRSGWVAVPAFYISIRTPSP